MLQQYTYRSALEASERINWRIEDIIGGDKTLDFTRPFMPESLARVEPLTFLDREQKLALNQIRGHGYLYIFGLVEEFILPFVMDHARQQLAGNDYRTRAMLRFATEEAKHIHLFKRFRKEFEEGFGTHCDVIGPADEIAKAVLAHDPLAVALVILHIEWMTQSHYVESVKDDQKLDTQFKSLLSHHWMEEAQHARLDTLMVRTIAERSEEDDIARAVDEYIQIGGMIDGGLKQQVALDAESLARATGRVLTDPERAQFEAVQLKANRWTFLGSGMRHRNFLATLQELSPAARKRVEDLSPAFC
jgi:hypothetical protein